MATSSGRIVEIAFNWLFNESEAENDTLGVVAGVATRLATGWLDSVWGILPVLNSISIRLFLIDSLFIKLPSTWHIGSLQRNFSCFLPFR